ncbi:MAG: hypothetical protein WC749_08220 [Dehalococcoidia bacterium]
MTPEESLQTVLDCLERSGISYMLTGSFAGNMHGVPRTTHDADVVIDPDPSCLRRFVQTVSDRFYVDEAVALEALEKRGMFNVICYESGFKVDLIIRKVRPFSKEEFARKRLHDFLGSTRWFATPEDTILAKLEWSRMGGSERQLNDAVGIAKVQAGNLDIGYLQRWAQELGVRELLQRLLGELEKGESDG